MKQNKKIGETIFLTLIILTILIIVILMINLYAVNKGYSSAISMLKKEKTNETKMSEGNNSDIENPSKTIDETANEVSKEALKTSEKLKEKTKESTEKVQEVLDTFDNPYIKIINEYKNAMQDGNYDLTNAKTKYPNINQNMMQYYHNMEFRIFYAYYDINKDGLDELIILNQLGNGNYTIIDVFSHNGTSAVKLIDEYSLGERSNLQIFTNGIMYLAGSGGASSGVLKFYKIQLTGEVALYGEYYYQFDENNIVSFYSDVENKYKLNYSSIEEVVNSFKKDANILDTKNLDLTEIK